MKESYEELKMEVIAFDGDIFTGDDDGVPSDLIPASNERPSVLAG